MSLGILPELKRKLEFRQPAVEQTKLAGVSVIIDKRPEPRMFLIKRAERQGDPWSGQVAFPGGKMKEGDRTARQTAVRETIEEAGVDLARHADFLGYFGSFRTHTGNMEVIPSVFHLKGEVKVMPNEEVSSYRWVGLDEFLAPRSRSTYRVEADGVALNVPAYALGDYVVWGLTQRIISSLLG
ncbi:MAG: CoA pyrophosphatase [Nitrososphaerales archaeon]|nr:CoA pyrophosphatase [Nitrososphaerales archaeon]